MIPLYCLLDSYVKIISQAKNQWLWHTKPILFEKFFAYAMCISQIYECNQLHRYILCIVVVIMCNEHWEQGYRQSWHAIQSCFPCSPYQCQHHLNYIHIPCPELSCFTVTVFQNFGFKCMVSTVYVSKQRSMIEHIMIIVYVTIN